MDSTIKIIVRNTPEEVGVAAADVLIDRIQNCPRFTLGCATGGTVIPLYRELVRRHTSGTATFTHVRTFNLDEYVGIPRQHPQSYWSFMQQQLFSHIHIPQGHIRFPDGSAHDLNQECAAYERAIADAGGIDLQILGIGRNGHIAFNEPGSGERTRTRVVHLSMDTIHANSDGRFFKNPSDVPTQAITMGIATILEARELLLIATGRGKAEAVSKALQEPPTLNVPASLLQRHPQCTFIIDRDAATLLP